VRELIDAAITAEYYGDCVVFSFQQKALLGILVFKDEKIPGATGMATVSNVSVKNSFSSI
jgi:hypothetical protein